MKMTRHPWPGELVDEVRLNTSAYDLTLEAMLDRGLRQFRFPTPNSFDASFGQSSVSTEIIAKPNKRHRLFDYCQNWTFIDKLDPASGAERGVARSYRIFAGPCTAAAPAKLSLDPGFVRAFRTVNGAVAAHLRAKGWRG